MKKLLLLSTFCLMAVTATFAQHQAGDLNLNAGIGLGSSFGVGNSILPPLGVSVEYGMKENISVGGYAAFSSSSEKYDLTGFNGKWKYTYIIIGARGSYHFLQSEKLDPYAGVFLGYIIGSSKWEGTGTPTSTATGGLGWSGHLGARYKLNEKFGAYAELGYGVALLQVGVNMKL